MGSAEAFYGLPRKTLIHSREAVTMRAKGVASMTRNSAVFRIALVGGDDFCKEVLEKYLVAREEGDASARIAAVADPDPVSPGMVLATKLGWGAVEDYHEIYKPAKADTLASHEFVDTVQCELRKQP